jgi:hypothetical protein
VSSALLSLAGQLRGDSSETTGQDSGTGQHDQAQVDDLNALRIRGGGSTRDQGTRYGDDGRASKRRRVESHPQFGYYMDASLPPEDVMEAVIVKYFATVHHWIPTVHERRFRARLKDEGDAPNLKVVLHGMVLTALKHVDRTGLSLDATQINEHVKQSTAFVVNGAMEGLSIENCQALIMLCFERMGSGDWHKVFPLLASLVRSVDYLGLTVEPNESRPKPLLPPLTIVKESSSNAETEERKRVFWSAFMLDRIVSISSGYSTGFTSDNVSRQLPCNGGIWRRNEESSTPYFGIWEKSQARIGQSITSLPTHKPSPNEVSNRSPGSTALNISQLGALACVSSSLCDQLSCCGGH